MQQEDDTDGKIIFMIQKLNEPIEFNSKVTKKYRHCIGESPKMEEGLKRYMDDSSDWISTFKKVMEKNEEGKFYIDNFIIYVLPKTIAVMYTCQYPFIVMKNGKVIDIDEYWYTPFKNMLAEHYKCRVLDDFDDLNSEIDDTSFEYVEHSFAIKCTTDNKEDAPLVAIRTSNITFSI